MTKLKKFELPPNSDTITIADIAGLSQQVGENTSDIQYLKQQSEIVNEMEKQLVGVKADQKAVKADQKSIKGQLEKLEAGVNKFRYHQWSVLVLIFVCIVGTLGIGLKYSKENQDVLKENLEKSILIIDDRQKEDTEKLSSKMDEIITIILKKNLTE